MASADVEGAFDGIRHEDVEKPFLQKGVHPEAVSSLLRESCDLKGRISLPSAPISPDFLYARGARQVSVEGPDMWNQVLDNALREPAARWENQQQLASDLPRSIAKPKRGVVAHLVRLRKMKVGCFTTCAGRMICTRRLVQWITCLEFWGT